MKKQPVMVHMVKVVNIVHIAQYARTVLHHPGMPIFPMMWFILIQ